MSLIFIIVKLKHCFSVLALSIFISSSISGVNRSLEIGKEAPELALADSIGSKSFSLGDFKGRHVLINFWSTAEPESRLANIRFCRLAAQFPKEKLAFISVNIDDDENLAREVMSLDGTDTPLSFTSSQLLPESLENYQADSACRSFLIDEFGNLKAIPDSSTDLSTLI